MSRARLLRLDRRGSASRGSRLGAARRASTRSVAGAPLGGVRVPAPAPRRGSRRRRRGGCRPAAATGSTCGRLDPHRLAVFSASTSLSIVLRKSFEALRNSAIILPRLLPISGSLRGPEDDQGHDEDQEELGSAQCSKHVAYRHAPDLPSTRRTAVSIDTSAARAPRVGHARPCWRPPSRPPARSRRCRGRADIPVVELDGVVHAVSAAHVVQAIERADAAGAPLVVLRIDTPGGLDTLDAPDHRQDAQLPDARGRLRGPSGARAASAGFVITIAADVAAMAPGTNIGAAHPVSGLGQMDEVMSKKVTSDAAAYIRSKAERRGRNVEMAEKAVVESQSFTEKEALELQADRPRREGRARPARSRSTGAR